MRARCRRTLVCVLASWHFGCVNANKAERAVDSNELPWSGEAADGAGWQTAPFPTADDCAEKKASWLKLESKARSDGLVIAHDLGRAPDVVLPYTSPAASGCASKLGADDTVIIEYADEQHVKIRNNGTEVVYVRLVLQ